VLFSGPLIDQIQDRPLGVLMQSTGRKYGLGVLGKAVRGAVDSAATDAGEPDELFHASLAKAYSEKGVISALRFTLAGFVRTWQTNAFALFLLVLFLPVVFLRLTAVFQPRRRTPLPSRTKRTALRGRR
jgi:hypothetical protein